MYLQSLDPKSLLSLGLCDTSSTGLLAALAHPQPLLASKQAHWSGDPKPGEHPYSLRDLPVNLRGPWLSNHAAWVAGSSLGLLLGFEGYLLPNRIPTP